MASSLESSASTESCVYTADTLQKSAERKKMGVYEWNREPDGEVREAIIFFPSL